MNEWVVEWVVGEQAVKDRVYTDSSGMMIAVIGQARVAGKSGREKYC